MQIFTLAYRNKCESLDGQMYEIRFGIEKKLEDFQTIIQIHTSLFKNQSLEIENLKVPVDKIQVPTTACSHVQTQTNTPILICSSTQYKRLTKKP